MDILPSSKTMKSFEEEVLKRLERIERYLVIARPKKTWVKVAIIAQRTGWNNEKMRQARDNGLVKYKKENGKFFYDLDSIHQSFLITK